MWGSHTKYVAAAQLWWAPPKNPQKFMHKQYKLYTRRHLLKISFEKFFKKFSEKI